MSYNNTQTEIEEDNIDLGKLFSHLKNHFFSIFFITLLTTLGAVAYVYFLNPIYSSDVTISFSDEKTSKLTSVIATDLAKVFSKDKEKELKTVELTLKTRKFINSAISDLDISQRYYIEEKYRKNAVYNLKNLKVDLKIKKKAYQNFKPKREYKEFFKNIDINNSNYYYFIDLLPNFKQSSLYEQLFQITPIDKKNYQLSIDSLNYSKVCRYGKRVKNKYFTIRVDRIGNVSIGKNYFVSKSDTSRLADEVLKNMTTSILSENVLKIEYQDIVPQRAKEIAEKIAETFRAFTLHKKTSEISQTLDFLNQEIQKIEIVLKGEGKKLKDYQTESDSFLTIQSNNVALVQGITRKEELLKTLNLQLTELESFKQNLENGQLNTISLLNSGIKISSIQSLIELFRADEVKLSEMELQSNNFEKSITRNSQLSQLIQNLNKKRKLLEELQFNFTENHPQVIKAYEDITQIKTEIQGYIETTIYKLQTNLSTTKNKILHNIIMTEQNIQTKLNMLTEDIQKEHQLLQTLPKKSFNIQELKRKFNFSENIYTFLLQKKMAMDISLASTIADTQIIENARKAVSPIKPKKKLIVMIGFILGLILSLLYTFLRVTLNTKIKDEEIIKELTDIPLYGILPNMRKKHFFEEALRAIRTNIQFILKHNETCTTILISSTISKEGKTTIVAGLSKIIAQTDKKILMIDLDLRKPRLYQELKKSNNQGVTHYLTGALEIDECIQKVSKNLDFFPAGAVPPNPSELLMSDKFKEMIHRLQEQYDYILFDTTPIGSVIDANMLIAYSDILLLIVRVNMSDKTFIEKFNQLKREKSINCSGIILNDLKRGKADGYGYDYGN